MDDCGSRSKQLEQLLKEYQTHLELDNPDSEFTGVHAFGPYNFHQEHNKFKALLNGILSRCKQCKSWNNSKQAVKAFVDRQQQIKLLLPLKNYIAECLDKLQSVIRDNNLTDTIHHLELITRQVGLKFDVSTTHTECFIMSDMFYVEVQLEENGNILEVKVAHAGESATCPVLTTILRRRDYKEFLKHMQGLASLYQLSGDGFQKENIFQALVTLEKDIQKIAYSDGHHKSFEENVLRGPVGIVTPRQGGQLMRLTYFAKPVELQADNIPRLMDENFDLYSLVHSDFGRSLSISVEQSKPRLLPTTSLVSDNHYGMSQEFADDRLGNIFLAINETNSEELPASFVLHLDKPLVVSASILERIYLTLDNYEGEKFVQNSKAHMDCLIIKEWLKEKKMDYHPRMAYRQKLPDEDHIYRIAEKDIQGNPLQNSNIGVIISRIPFTHCRNVVDIIQLIRQQLVYNQLLTSVLSSLPCQDGGIPDEDNLCFDVGTCSPFIIVVTFEEPITSSLASVEFQVKHDCTIGTRFKFSPRKAVFYDCGYVTRVIQRCLSIPVTMKYIFKKARNIQSDGDFEMVMQVDASTEVSKPNFTAPPTQTTAVTLLASMIGGSDVPTTAVNPNAALGMPLLSPSPTLQNFLTPSPTCTSFSFGSHDRQEASRLPASESLTTPILKEKDLTPPPRPSIKIKLKKVASSDKYVIETPKGAMKHEPSPSVDNTSTDLTSMFEMGEYKPETVVSSQYQLPVASQEQFIQIPANAADQAMEFASECMSFTDVDNLGTSLLGSSASGVVPGTSGVTDVDGIFQTLPGGATGSPGGLDVDDPYGFETGLDSGFDIDAEIDAATVAGVPSDSTAFDISNVYDPGPSTSSASTMGSFDIDSSFDLDTILANGSQSTDGSVNAEMSLDWGLGTDSS